MTTIEFDYDLLNGQTVTIIGEIDNQQIYFKVFEGERRVSKGNLTSLDYKNIESFIADNSDIEDLEYESDAFERQND